CRRCRRWAARPGVPDGWPARRRLTSPADLEAGNANLVGGALGGGTNAGANAGAHPGGGVHGGPGANAARAALARDARLTGAGVRRIDAAGASPAVPRAIRAGRDERLAR
ncbi:MAG TPA: hypothetical protein VF163_02715, partial [Micromonosporaceae bacterium]